jgi:glycosyltransferase involved in cell wall biosynthesis
MCLSLIDRIVAKFPNAGLIIGVGDGNFERGAKSLGEVIEQRRLGTSVYVANGGVELWPLMTKADLFLRPTTTDGASVSVLEALYLGCPVLASDAVPRPQNVVLFNTDNMESFHESATAILSARQVAKVSRERQ